MGHPSTKGTRTTTGDGAEGHLLSQGRWVGASLAKKDAQRFVGGTVDYAADLIRPGTLYVSLLRSPHAHAAIRSIDAEQAKRTPGIVAILTGAEVRTLSKPMPTRVPRERFPGPIDVWCLAIDETIYVGQPVVAVVAERQGDGEAARGLIKVDYEPLDAVLDARRGADPSASKARSAWSTNVVFQDKIRQGDVDAAMRDADRVVRGSMSFGSATTAPMECRCYVADWDTRSDRLTLQGTMQQPHPTRWLLSQALDLPETKIRVVAPAMGGTFGLKMVGHPEEVIVSVLSRLLERPVAFLESREECFLANAREQIHEFEIGARADGKIVAFRNFVRADVGAIGAGGGWLMAFVTPTVFPTVYNLPNVAIDSQVVTTNKPPWQGVRGYGKETANVVMERAIELISVELGIDPLEVRRRNLIPKDAFPHRLPSGLNLDSGDYEGALDQLSVLFDRERWLSKKVAAEGSGRRIGIGYAFELTPEGASFPGSMPSGFETSMVTIDPTGTVRVATSVTSPGSGNETGIAQLVADVFGIHPDHVSVTQGDTDTTPFGGGNTSSRSLMFGGAASVLAARDLRDRVALCAAVLLQAERSQIEFADGRIAVHGDIERSLPFAKAVTTIYTQAYSTAIDVELPLQVTRTYRSDNIRHTPDEWGRISSYPSFPYGVHAAVVEVDEATGCVAVLDYSAIHDCGVVINPGLVEGQFKGAVAMGIGAALWEELLHDADGRTRTNRFKSYVLPRATDLPNFRVGHRCTPSPFNPLGVKGAGESGFGGAMAVIANAVADALGNRGRHLNRMPCKPDVIVELLAREWP
ncbi:xanthine dehydrogenase family protein molybdopterin-binding subunit [Bradyrhizobium australafricanum]|uniref:xanthine dehydrogenase family protein molybdopterin-binding subunit n=1 Tax=Bradyrhizobium australafricanum TaxID=2821406 RepID=UPI001CE2EA5E|nr:xanthine dehydrogenase family protein molybdopterin-binding subunit [Bradyrhizobium australafricanum]MCA6100545.1 xanthine dehydrogenase family protein [Bradyrhizobium australafricanum]